MDEFIYSHYWTILITALREKPPNSNHNPNPNIYQVKSSQVFYCQFFHMYSTYIQRIEIA